MGAIGEFVKKETNKSFSAPKRKTFGLLSGSSGNSRPTYSSGSSRNSNQNTSQSSQRIPPRPRSSDKKSVQDWVLNALSKKLYGEASDWAKGMLKSSQWWQDNFGSGASGWTQFAGNAALGALENAAFSLVSGNEIDVENLAKSAAIKYGASQVANYAGNYAANQAMQQGASTAAAKEIGTQAAQGAGAMAGAFGNMAYWAMSNHDPSAGEMMGTVFGATGTALAGPIGGFIGSMLGGYIGGQAKTPKHFVTVEYENPDKGAIYYENGQLKYNPIKKLHNNIGFSGQSKEVPFKDAAEYQRAYDKRVKQIKEVGDKWNNALQNYDSQPVDVQYQLDNFVQTGDMGGKTPGQNIGEAIKSGELASTAWAGGLGSLPTLNDKRGQVQRSTFDYLYGNMAVDDPGYGDADASNKARFMGDKAVNDNEKMAQYYLDQQKKGKKLTAKQKELVDYYNYVESQNWDNGKTAMPLANNIKNSVSKADLWQSFNSTTNAVDTRPDFLKNLEKKAGVPAATVSQSPNQSTGQFSDYLKKTLEGSGNKSMEGLLGRRQNRQALDVPNG